MPKELANSQQLVEIEDVKQNTVVLKNGGLRQILMIGGINFALKSEEEQNAITGAFQNFLNSIGFPLQILIHSRKINTGRYLDFLEKRSGEEPSELLKNQIYEYREFIRGFVQENPIMAKSFLVVVPFSPITIPKKEAVQKYIPFFGGKKKSAEEEKVSAEQATADFQNNLEQIQQRVAEVAQGLQAVGLEVKLLDDEELIELFYNFYNPETVEKENINLPDQSKN